MLVDPHAGAEGLGILQEGMAHVFHLLDLLGLHHEESVPDEGAEPQGDQYAVGGGSLGDGALELVVGQRAQGVQRIEDLANRRSGEIVDAELFPDYLVLAKYMRTLTPEFLAQKAFVEGVTLTGVKG